MSVPLPSIRVFLSRNEKSEWFFLELTLDHNFSDDLASVVKRRRVLAARAAAEREEREQLDRERRAALAQEYAQERALSAVLRMHDMRSAEARCALRCHPIGYDRYYRRIWYFRCAPDCLFVESNWAASQTHYPIASISGACKSKLSMFVYRQRVRVGKPSFLQFVCKLKCLRST